VPARTLDAVRAFAADPTRRVRVKPLDTLTSLSIRAIPRDQVPDMPDRIIAATALAHDLPLVTRDHRIRAAAVRPSGELVLPVSAASTALIGAVVTPRPGGLKYRPTKGTMP
jgi:hypothetical protein